MQEQRTALEAHIAQQLRGLSQQERNYFLRGEDRK